MQPGGDERGCASAMLGMALAFLQASCALEFTDYPAEEAGAGGEGGTTTQTTGGSGAGGAGGEGGEGGQVPECARTVLAIDKLFFDQYPDGGTSIYAWKGYGANLDGQTTNGNYSMHCTPNAGANPSNSFLDGDDGIDNSFGNNLVPRFPSFNDDIDGSITAGNAGYFFDLVDLTEDPDQAGITTRFYGGAPLETTPVFDGTQCWDVDGATVTDPDDVRTAAITFTGGLLSGHVWQSGLPQTLTLTFRYQGVLIPITIHRAKVVAQLANTHDATQPQTFGYISGILDTEEFVVAVSRYIRAWMPAYCSVGFPEYALWVRQASDILIDGTQDPEQVCNGISIGIGFTAKPVLLGGVGAGSYPATVNCPTE